MSNARAAFSERFATLELTLNESYVQDGALHEIEKNRKAQLIRNGLAVVAFSYVEDFVRQRIAEVLAGLSSLGVSFSTLPERIREACTFGLLKPLYNRASLIADPTSRTVFAQDHARFLASTMALPFQLSELSFGYRGSNVSAEEIAEILRAFQVQAPWENIKILAGRVGLGSLSPESAFTNAAKRRHQAAHVAGTITPIGDLIAFVNEARGIAFGFDSLLSSALLKMKRRDAAFAAGTKLDANAVALTLLFFTNGRAREKVWGSARARATAVDMATLESTAIPRADVMGAALALLGAMAS